MKKPVSANYHTKVLPFWVLLLSQMNVQSPYSSMQLNCYEFVTCWWIFTLVYMEIALVDTLCLTATHLH
jgi:hypothetical protein